MMAIRYNDPGAFRPISLRRPFAQSEPRSLAADQLCQAQKMAMLGQFTCQFAHDFSNILAAVLLNLEVLRGTITPVERAEAADHAMTAVEQGQKIISTMLAFARREPVKSEALYVNWLLASLDVMVRQALGSSSELIVAVPPETWPVRGDRVQMELAILNLALNAHDAMPDGGTLRIATSNVRLRGEPNGLRGEFVALAVSDTGTGIPRDVIARVFDPFFTTKDKGKGTGLGLSQVHGFATACGGTATAESRQGGGTTITVYLPRTPEASALATAQRQVAGAGVDA